MPGDGPICATRLVKACPTLKCAADHRGGCSENLCEGDPVTDCNDGGQPDRVDQHDAMTDDGQ
jgi:hypothetical protein